MVGNIGKNASASATVDYVFSKGEDAEVVASMCGAARRAEVIEAMQRAVSRKRALKNPVFHASIALVPGERLSTEQWGEVARTYTERMGFGESEWVAVLHTDTEHEHIHVVASRVDMWGKTVSDSWDWRRSEAIMRELEREYGLTRLPERGQRGAEVVATRQPAPTWERAPEASAEPAPRAKSRARWHFEKRTGDKGAITRIQEIVSGTGRGERVAGAAEDGVREEAVLAWRGALARRGVDVGVRVEGGREGEEARVVGVVYSLEGYSLSGRHIGPKYSLTGLTEHFGPITPGMWERVGERIARELEPGQALGPEGVVDNQREDSADRSPVRTPERGVRAQREVDGAAGVGEEVPASPESRGPRGPRAGSGGREDGPEAGEGARVGGVDPVTGGAYAPRGERDEVSSLARAHAHAFLKDIEGEGYASGEAKVAGAAGEGEGAASSGLVVEEGGPRAVEMAAALAQTTSTRQVGIWLARLSARGVEVVPRVSASDVTKVRGLYLRDTKTGKIWESSMVDRSASWPKIQARFGLSDHAAAGDLFARVVIAGGVEVVDNPNIAHEPPEVVALGSSEAGAPEAVAASVDAEGVGDEEHGEDEGEALRMVPGGVPITATELTPIALQGERDAVEVREGYSDEAPRGERSSGRAPRRDPDVTAPSKAVGQEELVRYEIRDAAVEQIAEDTLEVDAVRIAAEDSRPRGHVESREVPVAPPEATHSLTTPDLALSAEIIERAGRDDSGDGEADDTLAMAPVPSGPTRDEGGGRAETLEEAPTLELRARGEGESRAPEVEPRSAGEFDGGAPGVGWEPERVEGGGDERRSLAEASSREDDRLVDTHEIDVGTIAAQDRRGRRPVESGGEREEQEQTRLRTTTPAFQGADAGDVPVAPPGSTAPSLVTRDPASSREVIERPRRDDTGEGDDARATPSVVGAQASEVVVSPKAGHPVESMPEPPTEAQAGVSDMDVIETGVWRAAGRRGQGVDAPVPRSMPASERASPAPHEADEVSSTLHFATADAGDEAEHVELAETVELDARGITVTPVADPAGEGGAHGEETVELVMRRTPSGEEAWVGVEGARSGDTVEVGADPSLEEATLEMGGAPVRPQSSDVSAEGMGPDAMGDERLGSDDEEVVEWGYENVVIKIGDMPLLQRLRDLKAGIEDFNATSTHVVDHGDGAFDGSRLAEWRLAMDDEDPLRFRIQVSLVDDACERRRLFTSSGSYRADDLEARVAILRSNPPRPRDFEELGCDRGVWSDGGALSPQERERALEARRSEVARRRAAELSRKIQIFNASAGRVGEVGEDAFPAWRQARWSMSVCPDAPDCFRVSAHVVSDCGTKMETRVSSVFYTLEEFDEFAKRFAGRPTPKTIFWLGPNRSWRTLDEAEREEVRALRDREERPERIRAFADKVELHNGLIRDAEDLAADGGLPVWREARWELVVDERDPERFRVHVHVLDEAYTHRQTYTSVDTYGEDSFYETLQRCQASKPGPRDLQEMREIREMREALSRDEREEISRRRVAVLAEQVDEFNRVAREAPPTPRSHEPWRQASWSMQVDPARPDCFRVSVGVVDDARERVVVYTSVERYPVEEVGSMRAKLLAGAPGPDEMRALGMQRSGSRALSPTERRALPLPPRSLVEALERANSASRPLGTGAPGEVPEWRQARWQFFVTRGEPEHFRVSLEMVDRKGEGVLRIPSPRRVHIDEYDAVVEELLGRAPTMDDFKEWGPFESERATAVALDPARGEQIREMRSEWFRSRRQAEMAAQAQAVDAAAARPAPSARVLTAGEWIAELVGQTPGVETGFLEDEVGSRVYGRLHPEILETSDRGPCCAIFTRGDVLYLVPIPPAARGVMDECVASARDDALRGKVAKVEVRVRPAGLEVERDDGRSRGRGGR